MVISFEEHLCSFDFEDSRDSLFPVKFPSNSSDLTPEKSFFLFAIAMTLSPVFELLCRASISRHRVLIIDVESGRNLIEKNKIGI